MLATAAPADITVSVHTATVHPTIGDSLSVYCRINAPEGVTIGDAYFRTIPPLVDIEKAGYVPTDYGQNSSSGVYRFLMYVFAPDTLRVGPVVVDYITADGDSGTAESDMITLYVGSVVDSPEAPPLPNRSPFEIAGHGFRFLLMLLLAILAVAAILAGIFIYRRRKGALSPVFDGPVDELGELEQIRKLNLNESVQYKELYFLVSTALRGFIHRNLGFEAMYETTDEIIRNLSCSNEDHDLTASLAGILSESDQVKFARFKPSTERVSTLIDRAIDPVRILVAEFERRKRVEIKAREAASVEKHDQATQSAVLAGTVKGGDV